MVESNEMDTLDVVLFSQERLSLCDDDSKGLHLPLLLVHLANLVVNVYYLTFELFLQF